MKRLLLPICLLAMLGTTAFPAPEAAEKDPRLDLKVTIKTVGKPLGGFLAIVSEATGVKMTARKEAADHKVCMYVKDLPLSELQDALKTVLHLQCTREGKKGAWDYTFWEDAKTKHEIELLKQKELVKARDSIMRLIGDLALSPETLKSKFGDDELIPGPLTDPEHRAMLGALSRIDKSLFDSLWQGQRLDLDETNLSADDLRKILQGANEGEVKHRREFAEYRAQHPEDFEDFPEDEVETRWKTVNSIELEVEDSEYDSGISLSITTHGEKELVDPQSVPEDEDFYTGEDSSETNIDPYAYDDAQKYAKFMEEHPEAEMLMSDEESPDANSGDSTDPKPDVQLIKIKIKKSTSSYGLLVLVAEQTNRSVVSDYFTFLAMSYFQPGDEEAFELPAGCSMDIIAMMMEARTEEQDNLDLCINELWYKNREREVPDRLIQRWKGVLEAQGYLGLKEVLEISQLTDVQIAALDICGLPSASEVQWQRKLLQFVAGLSTDQWNTAMSEEGLAMSGLSAEQHKSLIDYVQTDEYEQFSWLMDTDETTAQGQAAPEIQVIKLSSSEESLEENGVKLPVWRVTLKTQYSESDASLPVMQKNESEEYSRESDADGTVEISVAGKT